MTAMVDIQHLSFAYPDGRLALMGVSLAVNEGERVALIGPNGAGKSTLLLHLNGILRGEGRIVIDGLELAKATLPEIRRRVGLIFQDPNDQLFCPTVGDDVAFGPLHFGWPREKIDRVVCDALAAVGMEAAWHRPAHHLSVGERRRVTMAAVLACDPKVLALDEPAAMLDPKRRRWLVDFLCASHHTVLLATHDLDVARATCARTILMHGGRIVADGATETILADAALLASHDL